MYSVSPDSRLLVLLRTTQVVDIVQKIYNYCGSCVSFCVRVCACMFCTCSSIYIVYNRGKTAARQKAISVEFIQLYQLLFLAVLCPFSIEKNKNKHMVPGCLATGRWTLKSVIPHISDIVPWDCGMSDAHLPKSKKILKNLPFIVRVV